MNQNKEEILNKQKACFNRNQTLQSTTLMAHHWNQYQPSLKHHKRQPVSKIIAHLKEHMGNLPLHQIRPKVDSTYHNYQSIIVNDLNKTQPAFKKVRLSQLTIQNKYINNSKNKPVNNNKKCFALSKQMNSISKRQKKLGYEGKQVRLKRQIKQLENTFSYYGRIESSKNIKLLIQNLRQQIIRENINNFSLLKQIL